MDDPLLRGGGVVAGRGSSSSEALRLADVRMYADKGGRVAAGSQAADALLRVLNARSPELEAHNGHVAALSRATAAAIGLGEQDAEQIVQAAQLHDIGKAAVPDAVLDKAGPLDQEEWRLMRRHTLVGERVMLAVPALARPARLVRSSHERVDGTGYPDGLKGDQIALGARIVFVCDAFDAMTSPRPYAEPMSVAGALAELRRCAGTSGSIATSSRCSARRWSRAASALRPSPPDGGLSQAAVAPAGVGSSAARVGAEQDHVAVDALAREFVAHGDSLIKYWK